ncbi:hypothetical protein [Acidithiobacillus thiooxidans]|uniref:hypothetical protein n=1 Tax=Acidithiobacillus thiooxidans TaxID=930 RepID=UPI00356B5BB0|nr:hypothetical protein [Acidithiobacillus sp.]
MTEDLFPDLKPPRRKPRKLMHVCDAYGDGPDHVHVCFRCSRCGHETDWIDGLTVTEAKRGIPCPMCNKTEDDPIKEQENKS